MGECVYETHPNLPASKCDVYGVGRSKEYPNLCDNNGKIYNQAVLNNKGKH